MQQSGLETPLKNGERAAAIVGSGAGGLATLERAYEDILVYKKKATHPLTLLRTIISSAVGPCQHRARHQGAGFRHRQRVLDGGALHRPCFSHDPGGQCRRGRGRRIGGRY